MALVIIAQSALPVLGAEAVSGRSKASSATVARKEPKAKSDNASERKSTKTRVTGTKLNTREQGSRKAADTSSTKPRSKQEASRRTEERTVRTPGSVKGATTRTRKPEITPMKATVKKSAKAVESSEKASAVIGHDPGEFIDITLPEYRQTARPTALTEEKSPISTPVAAVTKSVVKKVEKSPRPATDSPSPSAPVPKTTNPRPSPRAVVVPIQEVIITAVPETAIPIPITAAPQRAIIAEDAGVVLTSLAGFTASQEEIPAADPEQMPARSVAPLELINPTTPVWNEKRGCYLYGRGTTVKSDQWTLTGEGLAIHRVSAHGAITKVEASGHVRVTLHDGAVAEATNATCEAKSGDLVLKGRLSFKNNGQELGSTSPAAKMTFSRLEGHTRIEGPMTLTASTLVP